MNCKRRKTFGDGQERPSAGDLNALTGGQHGRRMGHRLLTDCNSTLKSKGRARGTFQPGARLVGIGLFAKVSGLGGTESERAVFFLRRRFYAVPAEPAEPADLSYSRLFLFCFFLSTRARSREFRLLYFFLFLTLQNLIVSTLRFI